jgi:hypothetical protein
VRIAGHSSIVISQRYNHPTPEAVERAFGRLQPSTPQPEMQGERRLPAAISATLDGAAAVSH